MNFETILKIVQGAGDIVPAFTQLFEQVLATFGEDDQAKLKEAYAAARAKSDDVHRSTQDKLAEAAKL